MEKIYWGPTVRWHITDKQLVIECYEYEERFQKLFPRFYYEAQKGCSMEELIKAFPQWETSLLEHFIEDLLKKKILVQGILPPKQLFYSQEDLISTPYSETIRYVKEDLEAYKAEVLSRNILQNQEGIPLQTAELPELFRQRRSCRQFDRDKKICFEVLSKLLCSLRQEENQRYYYGSAGGLYPIDVYLYVKAERVEGLQQGIYYYNPVTHSIYLVSHTEIDKQVHYFTNQSIFESSAVSLFFIYNAMCSMPKYGGNGYFYGILDTGIMIQTLHLVCETVGLGACSIGDMAFEQVGEKLQLNQSQVMIHDMEIGLRI